MKICTICQQQNSSTASFCRACGSVLKNLELVAPTMWLSDSATSPPTEGEIEKKGAEIEKKEEMEKKEEIETTLLLPATLSDVQIGELALPAISTEDDISDVETGPLEADSLLSSSSESEIMDDQTLISPPMTAASTLEAEKESKSQAESAIETPSKPERSAIVTDIAQPTEVEAAKTVDLEKYTDVAPSTALLPPLANDQDTEITIIDAIEAEPDPVEMANESSQSVADATISDQAQEANEPFTQEVDPNDETAPAPIVSAGAPSTGKLPPLPPEPLAVGTIVAQRYKIIEWISEEEGVNLYLAEDLYTCRVCGYDENPAGDQFCWDCGVDRTEAQKVLCELRESELDVATEQGELEAGLINQSFIYNDLFYLPIMKEIERQIEPLPNPLADPTRRENMTLTVGYASHVGMIRRLNEDSLSIFTLAGVYESNSDPSLGLFIVADGLGGHDGGEVASKFVVETIADRLIRRVLLPKFNQQPLHPDAIMPRVEEAVFYANEQLYNLAEERLNDMGCTLTMALVIGQQAYIANVGDSRTYIYRNTLLRQVTQDHSLVASLISAGIAQPHEIYTHPERNVIYRSMGHAPNVEVDLWQEELMRGDQLLLCSDGLWEAIRNEGIIEVLTAESSPQAACDEMLHRANLAGGEDNITVILVKMD